MIDFRPNLGGETVVILSAGTVTNRYSNPAESWDPSDVGRRLVTTIAPLQPFELQPAGEPVQDARNALTYGWVVYLPAGDPVTAHNRIEVRGEEFPVQGRPSDWGVGVVVRAFKTEG